MLFYTVFSGEVVMNAPYDWLNPQWTSRSHDPHNWHAYVTEEVRVLWLTFDEKQRKALATCFNEIASNEEWE